jgi:hypothetical protein
MDNFSKHEWSNLGNYCIRCNISYSESTNEIVGRIIATSSTSFKEFNEFWDKHPCISDEEYTIKKLLE